MNKVLEDQLIAVIGSAVEASKNVVDFTMEQAPVLVQQIMTYNLVSAGICFACSVLLMIAAKKAFNFFRKGFNEADSYSADPWVFGGIIVVGLMSIIGIKIGLSSLDIILKITLAPKLYLLEYISTLVK